MTAITATATADSTSAGSPVAAGAKGAEGAPRPRAGQAARGRGERPARGNRDLHTSAGKPEHHPRRHGKARRRLGLPDRAGGPSRILLTPTTPRGGAQRSSPSEKMRESHRAGIGETPVATPGSTVGEEREAQSWRRPPGRRAPPPPDGDGDRDRRAPILSVPGGSRPMVLDVVGGRGAQSKPPGISAELAGQAYPRTLRPTCRAPTAFACRGRRLAIHKAGTHRGSTGLAADLVMPHGPRSSGR